MGLFFLCLLVSTCELGACKCGVSRHNAVCLRHKYFRGEEEALSARSWM